MDNQEYRKRLITRAFLLSKTIIRFVDKFPSKKSADVISGQLLRAATSIAANIIEAQAASSKKDFTNFLNHALKSGNETKFWLALSKEITINTQEADKILEETNEIVKMLGSTVSTLRGRKL